MARIDEIKTQIQKAIEAVKDFDEPYKIKAFEVILAKFLEAVSIEKTVQETGAGMKRKALSPTDKIQKFAQATNLSVGQLENVFEFGEQGLRFIAPLTGRIAERQVSFAQCVLICLEHVYGKKTIATLEFTKFFDDFGLTTKNLARNIRRHNTLFRIFGKKKGAKYRLSDVGKTSAIELVRTLATSGVQS